jgi:hypothetical protein
MYLMNPDERRLLELLAENAEGCTDDLLTARGFKLDVLISVVSAEFATALPERTLAAGKSVERTRVRITDAGRRALADHGDTAFLYVPGSGRWPTGSSKPRLPDHSDKKKGSTYAEPSLGGVVSGERR